MAGGEHAERLAVAGIDRDRLLQQLLSGDIVLSRETPEMGQRSHHQAPGVHVARCPAPGMEIFRGKELRFDRGDDRFGDLVLHGEHVGEAAIVTFRPEMAAGGNVIELGGDADAVAILAHAAFDHVTDPEPRPRSA